MQMQNPKSVMQFRYVCWEMCLGGGVKFVNQVLIVALKYHGNLFEVEAF